MNRTIITERDLQVAMEDINDRLPAGLVAAGVVVFGWKPFRKWLFQLGLKLCQWSGGEVVKRCKREDIQ